MHIKVKNLRMYILLDADMNCDLLHERTLLSTERAPQDKKAIVLTTTKFESRTS
jgi:hypothetical protein